MKKHTKNIVKKLLPAIAENGDCLPEIAIYYFKKKNRKMIIGKRNEIFTVKL